MVSMLMVKLTVFQQMVSMITCASSEDWSAKVTARPRRCKACWHSALHQLELCSAAHMCETTAAQVRQHVRPGMWELHSRRC